MSEMKFKNTSIMHEFLSNCSDETVYKFLLKEDPQIWNNEITLKMLLAKDNALINLALAQTTNSFSVLKKLYKKNNEALRIACLGNSNIYNLDFDPFKRGIIPAMSSIFFTHDEYTNFITNSKNPNELIAVLTNKKFDLDNLANLYEKKDEPYISLDESRFMDLVYFTMDNPNLYLPSEDPLSWVGAGHDRYRCSKNFFNLFNIFSNNFWNAKCLNQLLKRKPNISFEIDFDFTITEKEVTKSVQEGLLVKSRNEKLVALNKILEKWSFENCDEKKENGTEEYSPAWQEIYIDLKQNLSRFLEDE